MCGIFCMLSKAGVGDSNREVCNRCLVFLKSRGPDNTSCYELSNGVVDAYFSGSVLWTQGDAICKQPAVDQSGNVLLWNGDIFDGVSLDNGDTETVLKNFNVEGVFETLSLIKGPYSFIYFDKNENKLYFGRDPLGRVSLLWNFCESSITLSSVSHSSLPMLELPPLGIFVLNCDTFDLSVKPWSHQINSHYTLPDCVIIDEPIVHKVLLNIKFEHQLETINNNFNFPEEFIKCNKDFSIFYDSLIEDNSLLNDEVNNLLYLLEKSVKVRCETRPPFCQHCKLSHSLNCYHPKIGILFSGGLDSTIIAFLAHKYIPINEPIDLYNVAFEKSSPNGSYNAPDRITGLSSFDLIQKLTPERIWNFVLIDITREELDSMRYKHINNLIYPLNSIIDDSLGCALWFAASGNGTLRGQTYNSPSTVVLLGMGADEMFGGYRKAKRAWIDQGWPGLCKELESGLLNLPIRNLGRDNRIVSDHGRVPRFPFLDESVVAYAYSLPPWYKCYLGKELPEGIGDKLLLRLVAWRLGLKSVSVFPKRALQFGSRIANSKEIGNDISLKLKEAWNADPT